ncbi:MAG TPA: sigma-54 dependent transcriptional regulator [Cyclobacteriaceae bacterium]|nr:sigma-54 dependent transcriptional regulator [Cyclobacteriaceae bacterium]
MHKILIIDDDTDIGILLSKFLAKNHYDAQIAHTGKAGLELLQCSQFDLVLCDYRLPDLTGTRLLQKIKAVNSSLPVIIISGYSEIKTVIESFRFGATDYIMKPFYPEEILITIREVLTTFKRAVKDNSSEENDNFIVGQSPQSKAVQQHISLIAPCDMSVLIIGETGTGKEFVAKSIHNASKRAKYPLVAIDCGAIHGELAGSELFGHVKGAFTGALFDKKGSFEIAQGGTIFLDEVGNLSYENQTRLLRVLQERVIKRIGSTSDIPIDVRIIAATNENLVSNATDKKFRDDLYHRLNEFKIQLTPLRDRKEDILFYAHHFLKKASLIMNKRVSSISGKAEAYLLSYPWFGNLRELNNVIRRAVLLSSGDEILPDALPQEILDAHAEGDGTSDEQSYGFLKSVTQATERQIIIDTLMKVQFNKSKASQLLNIDRKTLYNKLKLYNIPCVK